MALEIYGQKTGVDVYTEKPFVRITHNIMHTDHKIIKNGGGRLHGDGRLLGRIRQVVYMYTCSLQQIAGITPGGHNYRGCSNPLDTQIDLYPPRMQLFLGFYSPDTIT